MRNLKHILAISCLSTCLSVQVFAQVTRLDLRDLTAFRQPGKNWTIAGNASSDPDLTGDIKPIAGSGAVINQVMASGNSHLVTSGEYGDLTLELDFMMAKGSNSGVYLQGRYEVQLFDSWTAQRVSYSDCGGIYQRWDDARGKDQEGFEGSAPLVNASRAPGLWQHLKVVFRAPRFDAQGKKISNARFDAVYLNGVLVQRGVSVTGPTRAALSPDERPMGPLMLQGDHGNVAFRDLSFRAPEEIKIDEDEVDDDPIIIDAKGKPYLLRSYLQFGDRKLTHVVSYGHPDKLNFSYDLKQGALLQAWRGDFMDVTEMWHERGEPQLAKPRGNLLILSGAPALAVLAEPGSAWPDSIAFDDLANHGYVLDAERTPTFSYGYKGMEVTDKISGVDVKGIRRELTVKDPVDNLFCRLAVASTIVRTGANRFMVGDGEYYLHVDDRFKPVIRKTAKGTELVVPFTRQTGSLIYSLIF